MEKHHVLHIAVGCLAAALLFVALLAFGAGLQWATAVFVIAMVLCHLFGFYFLARRSDEGSEDSVS